MTKTPNDVGQDAKPRTFIESARLMLGHEPTGLDTAKYWRAYRKELLIMRRYAREVVEAAKEDNPLFVSGRVHRAMDLLEEQRHTVAQTGWDYHVVRCAELSEETE